MSVIFGCQRDHHSSCRTTGLLLMPLPFFFFSDSASLSLSLILWMTRFSLALHHTLGTGGHFRIYWLHWSTVSRPLCLCLFFSSYSWVFSPYSGHNSLVGSCPCESFQVPQAQPSRNRDPVLTPSPKVCLQSSRYRVLCPLRGAFFISHPYDITRKNSRVNPLESFLERKRTANHKLLSTLAL